MEAIEAKAGISSRFPLAGSDARAFLAELYARSGPDRRRRREGARRRKVVTIRDRDYDLRLSAKLRDNFTCRARSVCSDVLRA